MEIYLIHRHGFDSLENEIGSARYVDIIGFTFNEEDANKFISSKMEKIVPHKGWDGITYPYFTITKVKEV